MSGISLRSEGFPRQRLYRMPAEVAREVPRLPWVRHAHITAAGHYPNAEGHYIERLEGINEFILIACLAGKGWLKCRGSQRPVAAGEGILVPPQTPHSYGALNAYPWTIYWLHLSGDNAVELIQSSGLPLRPQVFGLPASEALSDSFEKILSVAAGGWRRNRLNSHSAELARLASLMSASPPATQLTSPAPADAVERAITFMREHLDRALTMEEVSFASGVSVPHLATLFREKAGTPPMRFFTRLRMQRAAEQLQDPNRRVQEIATACGYEDPLHFSRVFRRVMGMSPRAYRQHMAG